MNSEPHRRPYKMAFIDLDDTLLGPDKVIGQANLRALQRLRRAGVQIAIASGRHHRNITAMDQIGEQQWVLSSHGSVVRHHATGEILAERNLDPSTARPLYTRGADLGFSVIVYHRDGAFIERDSEWI